MQILTLGLILYKYLSSAIGASAWVCFFPIGSSVKQVTLCRETAERLEKAQSSGAKKQGTEPALGEFNRAVALSTTPYLKGPCIIQQFAELQNDC